MKLSVLNNVRTAVEQVTTVVGSVVPKSGDKRRKTVAMFAAALVVVAAVLVFVKVNANADSWSETHIQPGSYEITVPATGWYKLEVSGAQGGNAQAQGGFGGYSSGYKKFNAGDKVYAYVGEHPNHTTQGGFNGGGNGGDKVSNLASANTYDGWGAQAGGGGASDFRTSNSTSLTGDSATDPRIIVAGGGGGSASRDGTSYGLPVGGTGGGAQGGQGGYSASTTANPGDTNPGNGGKASVATGAVAGGTVSGGASGCNLGAPGSVGQGGSLVSDTNGWGAGGGGGWSGGGTGACTASAAIVYAGGGGSGFVTGLTYPVTQNGTNSGNGSAKISFVTADETLPYQGRAIFNYSDSYQTYTFPRNGCYRLEAWGAKGGNANNITGGYGGYTSGEQCFKQGQTVYIYTGGVGVADSTASGNKAGGYNGGGIGGHSSADPYSGAGGGGATDIRWTNLTTPTQGLTGLPETDPRIIVAGGGGGANAYSSAGTGIGGGGGGFTGASGNVRSSTGAQVLFATGGSQVKAGKVGGDQNCQGSSGNAGPGKGGDSHTAAQGWGGGGGGGWFGGGAGCWSDGVVYSGGGGSSYVGKTKNYLLRQAINNGAGGAIITFLYETTDNLEPNVTEFNAKSEFGESHAPQEYIVPEDGYYKLEAWGAKGGDAANSLFTTRQGGSGGYSGGTKYLTQGTRLYVYVGSAPATCQYNGGYNGGGRAGIMTAVAEYCYSGGGGATDIRTSSSASLTGVPETDPRLIVAGGGGGASGYPNTTSGDGRGGAGGGTSGGIGACARTASVSVTQPTGGTQWAPGTTINTYGQPTQGQEAAPGRGGSVGGSETHNGGGGSGWFGGANGTSMVRATCSGAGGSGFVGDLFYSRTSTAQNAGEGKARITKLADKLEPTPEGSSNGYSYTGNPATWVAPDNGVYRFETWGGEGAPISDNYIYHNSIGGKGGYSAGSIVLKRGDTFLITVGSRGYKNDEKGSKALTAGYNGGGQAGSTATNNTNGGGAGATDIRVGSNTLYDRIMVAGGGGGGDDGPNDTPGSNDGSGGGGGGLLGGTALVNGRAMSRYQSCNMTTDNVNTATVINGENPNQTNATQCSGYRFGLGETATADTDTGGAGGGWWGGKSTNNNQMGAGGGSGFISGMPGSLAVKGQSTTPKVSSTGTSCSGAGVGLTFDPVCSRSDTGFWFFDTKMIDGNGCPWADGVIAPPCGAVMPNPDGTGFFDLGNVYNGYAKITKVANLPLMDVKVGEAEAKPLSDSIAQVTFTDSKYDFDGYKAKIAAMTQVTVPEEQLKPANLKNSKYTLFYSTDEACINNIKAGSPDTSCAETAAPKSSSLKRFELTSLAPEAQYFSTIRLNDLDGEYAPQEKYYDVAPFTTLAAGQVDDSCAIKCKYGVGVTPPDAE